MKDFGDFRTPAYPAEARISVRPSSPTIIPAAQIKQDQREAGEEGPGILSIRSISSDRAFQRGARRSDQLVESARRRGEPCGLFEGFAARRTGGAGLNVPYETLTGDLSNVSASHLGAWAGSEYQRIRSPPGSGRCSSHNSAVLWGNWLIRCVRCSARTSESVEVKWTPRPLKMISPSSEVERATRDAMRAGFDVSAAAHASLPTCSLARTEMGGGRRSGSARTHI